MTKTLTTDPIDSFLDSKGGDMSLTTDDLKELRELFASKEVFDLTQQTYIDALERSAETDRQINETLKEICARDADKETRLAHVEDQHEHDEECHQLTEKKIDRKIGLATKRITLVGVCIAVFLGIIVPVARAYIPLIIQAVK